MGIYDREYYRREGPSILGSFTEGGRICKWLIGINIAVFVLQLITHTPAHYVYDEDNNPVAVAPGSSPVTDTLDLQTDEVVRRGQVWRVLTYAFLHDPNTQGIPWHIVLNMLFLWWFGRDVEDLYGPREFLAIYLVSALVGGLFFVLTHLGSNQACLGASGAVVAVMVLCAVHYPSRIIYLFFFLPVPIWLFVIFEVAQDAFGFLTGTAGRTAVTVHLGGAAFAFAYYKMHWRLLNILPGLRQWQRQRSRPRLRVYHEEQASPPPVMAPPGPDVDEQLEAKVDAVLEKVARYGQSSLTENERQILVRASEVYRKKRT
ncbi:MAG TPA: rhomboid family intramembrane serine protease [Gemmataceae bacterium]|jgi:membrane associated rhomboid family serine protease|nr:rhomboid family intramembrane serine protease [Gemmataceae bacterium]